MNVQKEQDNIELFLHLTGDLLTDEKVRSMTQYRHHGDVTTHRHSVFVAYTVMRMCHRLPAAQMRSIVRASLLHDFYLYEWYTEKHEENHIWYHPKAAVRNIEQHFSPLSPMQRNMILSHMFPLSHEVPAGRGAWALTLADKYCASADYLKMSDLFLPVYREINRRVDLL